jgi:hypothetical protein
VVDSRIASIIEEDVMTLRSLVVALLILALVLADGTARCGVIVVDPAGGPGGAALLQSAIDSAQPGDILLLQPGDYSSAPGSHPQVVDKSLALVLDGPPGSVVLSGLRLEAAAAGTVMLVRGLHVAPAPDMGLPSAAVEAVGGVVPWFEDCTFTASLLGGGATSGLLSGCATQTLVRCTITGADGADEVAGVSPAGSGADGARFGNPAIGPFAASIHECTIHGGRGGDGDPFVAGGTQTADGGAGVYLTVPFDASIMGCHLLGGDEGDNNPAATKPGPGLEIVLGIVNLRDTEVQAGAVNGAGTPSDDIVVQIAATVDYYPASTRGLSVPSPLREGQGSQLHAHGENGDAVWIYLGLTTGLDPVYDAQGNFVLGGVLPAAPIFLGTIGASGLLDYAFTMPNLPSGVDGFLIYMQSVMTPVTGGYLLGSGTALVWIDQAL